jgi:SAM-dependent methyltransferase
VQRVHAKRLLEFGCGEGLNIGLYWKLFPTEFNELAWAGFDYSPERSRRTEALLKYFYQLPNVLVWDGDAATRQVKPDYVDLAYSVHVLEQMPHHWQNALLEMRSAAKHVLLVEPIYERKSIGGKLHSRVNGYFRGSIREILDLGFELVREYDFPLRDPFNPSTALLLKRIGRSDESPITSED